ncbi:hypothetical protein [Prolixibacter sp. NT017]|uniref:hypothetical protein n=1 Tax=Prolixibacter sp. NT017 TaxID=2652390 RepID=UPI001278FA39|nr:hypothetical protein [Prolixibacter sp. NT017]GET23895.1 hypothetical protein NT017_02240 [Prolixibacter sp. NT017]
MSTVTFNFSVTLDENEFIKVEDHLFTTRESLKREEPKVDLINPRCLSILKEFEGRLTMAVVQEWLLLSRALDQTCSYHSKWDDHKLLEELISGREHPVSWYIENCQEV